MVRTFYHRQNDTRQNVAIALRNIPVLLQPRKHQHTRLLKLSRFTMPKRHLTDDTTPINGCKKVKIGDVEQNAKQRRLMKFPLLNMAVTKWKYSPTNDNDEPQVPQVVTFHIREPAAPTWEQVFRERSNTTSSSHDVVFVTNDGAKVPAHSLVIRIRVPYFTNDLNTKPLSGTGNFR